MGVRPAEFMNKLSELFQQTRWFSENSMIIYFATCVFTALAIVIAWKITVSKKANKSDITVKKSESSKSLGKKEKLLDDSAVIDYRELKEAKLKPTATCHPVQKVKTEEKNKKSRSKKSTGRSAAAATSAVGGGGGSQQVENRDPLEYASHIQSEVKKVQSREMWKGVEQEMSADERAKERQAQRDQLEAIFKLMESQKERFGVDSVGDVEQQVKLYM